MLLRFFFVIMLENKSYRRLVDKAHKGYLIGDGVKLYTWQFFGTFLGWFSDVCKVKSFPRYGLQVQCRGKWL